MHPVSRALTKPDILAGKVRAWPAVVANVGAAWDAWSMQQQAAAKSFQGVPIGGDSGRCFSLRRLVAAGALCLAAWGCGSEAATTTAATGGKSTSAAAGGSGGEGSAGETYQLTVDDGFGSGNYPAGAKVHVFASQDPYASVVSGWTSDDPNTTVESEWHTVITMPARDLRLTPVITSVAMDLKEQSWQGAARQKRVIFAVPPQPQGILFVFHGTGGSADVIRKSAMQYVVRLAYQRGYVVASTEAEERTLGDAGDDGKIRWNTQLSLESNIDLKNIQKLTQLIRSQASLGPSTPLFAAGMSNGGAFALSVGAALPFTAVTSYCATGIKTAAATTQTPSQWLMCANDTNETVSAKKATWQDGHKELLMRQVPTDYDEHPAAPIFDGRFARIDGVSEAMSKSAVEELRSKQKLGADGRLLMVPSELAAEIAMQPGAWPQVGAVVSASSTNEMLGQLRQGYADHQMFADWAARMLQFMEAQAAP